MRAVLERMREVEERKDLILLAGAGIRPFTPESIEKYQQEKTSDRRPTFSKVLFCFHCVVFAVGLIGLIGYGYAQAQGVGWWWNKMTAISWMTFLVTTVLGIAEDVKVRHTKKWQRHPLKGYSRSIPEFAHHMMRCAQKAVPQGEFCVEDLEVNGSTRGSLLCLELPPDSRLYLDVWRKPDLRAEREV